MTGTRRVISIALAVAFLTAIVGFTAAEEITAEQLDQRRNRINATAMLTLGSWALANIGLNTALYLTTEQDSRYFYQMNVLWNLLNLGIAGLGYYGSVRALPSTDLFTAVDAQYSMEKVLLLNAGLDTAYMMTGLFLMEYAGNTSSNSARIRGYGQSFLLQGGFLLVFDLVTYGIQRQSRKLLKPLLNE